MGLEEKKYDRCYARVDLEAIRSNILAELERIDPGTGLMAVIKADAYGHGAIPVARTLSDHVCGFGVAVIEEALKLRAARVDKMILILGYTGENWFEDLIRNDISQTVYSLEMAKQLDSVAEKLGIKAKVHIKVDTGMGRIGFAPTDENARIVKTISKLPWIETEGIFTHFARADEETPEEAKNPLRVFNEFVKKCEALDVSFTYRHAANSAAILNMPEAELDMVRSGISTYGLYPSEEMPHDTVRLKPAMEWITRVSFLKEVSEGTPISYGGTFVTKRKSIIATVPVGYADGMKRSLSNRGRVLINGCFAPIVGRICMDQFMIDVTDVPGVKEGDEVVIFGSSGDKHISVEEIADLAGSFNYEFVCGLTNRVPRKFVGETKRY